MNRVVTLVALLAIVMATHAARADELTASTTIDTFSSSGGLYGPWQTENLEYQWQAGPKDIPSITLVNRNDHDRTIFGQAVPTRSTALYADDYHNWSNSFFSYAQVMTSDGNILPNRLLYLEGDVKFGRRRNLLFGVGGSTYKNPDASYTRSLSIGPTLYTGSMVYTVRYLPAAVAGSFTGQYQGLPVFGSTRAYGSAVELVAEYNRLGSNQVIATYLGGNQPGLVVGSVGIVPTGAFSNIQRINEFDLSVEHWFRPDFGIVFGGTMASHALSSTGANLYHVSALTVGIFTGRAIGLPR